MIQRFLESLGGEYPLGEPMTDDLCEFKAAGMRFRVRAYTASGLGHVSVMSAAGMLGLMRMDSLIVNPLDLDAPLLSCDRIRAMGRDILVMEMYDTMLGDSFRTAEIRQAMEKYAELPDGEPKSYWYDDLIVPPSVSKKGARKTSAAFDGLMGDYFDAYRAALRSASACDPAEKARRASVYSEGLLAHGGPATDPVKKAIGEEKTARLFRELLFGVSPD